MNFCFTSEIPTYLDLLGTQMAVKNETHLSTRPNRKKVFKEKYWVLYLENT